MPDPQEQVRVSAPPDAEWGDVAPYEEEVPGHTPGVAEGEDEDDEERHAAHPYPDPDKTPGRAEG